MSADKDAKPRVLSRTPTSPVKLAHIVLRTPRYYEMRQFYKTFLNARAAFEDDIGVFLRYDDEHHRMAIVNEPELEDGKRGTGVEHYAFTYEALGDLLANYVRLKEAGIKPYWCVNHGMTISMYYQDPDGNRIETQVDTLDVTAADAYMRSEYFSINQVGVDFDPEVMLKRYLRGDAISELEKLGSAPYASDAERPIPPNLPDYDFRGALVTESSRQT